MAISLVCSWCGRKIAAPDKMAGKTGACPGCKGVVHIPAASPASQGGIGPPPGFDDPPHDDYSPQAVDAEHDSELSLEPAARDGEERRPCPACGESILVAAVKCRYCGEVYDEALRLTGNKGGRVGDEMTGVDWFITLLCPGIGCIVSLVRLIQGKKSGGIMLGISIVVFISMCIVLSVINEMTRIQRFR